MHEIPVTILDLSDVESLEVAIVENIQRDDLNPNTLRLLTLPSDVIAMLDEGTLTSGLARPLIGISNASSIAEEVVANNYS